MLNVTCLLEIVIAFLSFKLFKILPKSYFVHGFLSLSNTLYIIYYHFHLVMIFMQWELRHLKLCVCLFVLLFSSCHDHVLPQHHTSGTGSHDWDELHCSRWKAHQGSLGEGISYHQPRHEPLCGYGEGSGRWGHIHPAGERAENAIIRLISKRHIQVCPGLAVSERHHFLSKIILHFHLSFFST